MDAIHMRRNIGIAAAAAATLLLATHASAQTAGSGSTTNVFAGLEGGAVRGKQAGDLLVGLGAVGVLPTNGGSVSLIGGKPTASNAASPLLDFTYFLRPQVALNLIAASTEHDLTVQGSALGNVKLGHVWALPPTLTIQWHPLPTSRFSPYVGVGLNVTWFYGNGGALTPPVNRVRVDTSVGVSGNIGIDYEINPKWLLNVDAKYMYMEPTASVNSGLIHATAKINPWVISAAVRYRFSL
jgi:outer membrane protein